MDDTAFADLVAAESGRLARLGTLLTGDPARGRLLAEEALARALLGWRRISEDEPVSALRRSLFEVYGEWWHRSYRRYASPTGSADLPATGDTGDGAGAVAGGAADPAGSDPARTGASSGAAASAAAGSGPDGAGGRAAAGVLAADRPTSSGAGAAAVVADRPASGGAGAAAVAVDRPTGGGAGGGGARGAAVVAPPRARVWTPAAEDQVEWLAGLSHWARAVALMDAEGRSEPEMVALLGLSERTVARSRPEVPMLELATALATAEAPVPVARVTERATRIRRRRRIGAVIVTALLAVPAVLALGSAGNSNDQAEADRSCPTRLPGQVVNTGISGLEQQIVPLEVSRMYVCQFGADGVRVGAQRLDRRTATAVAGNLGAARLSGDTEVCSREDVIPFVLRIMNGDQGLTLLANPDGCGRVTNGVRTVSVGRDLLTQVLAGEQVTTDPEPAVQACAGLPQTVRNEGGNLANRLVGFAGDRVIVCPQGLAEASVGEVNGEAARAIAVAMDQAPTRKAGAAGTNCPSARRLVVVITSGVQRVDIVIDASGCGWATNGVRVVELDAETQSRLRHLAQLKS